MQTREERVIELITQARDSLSIHLGKCDHYYSEQEGVYIYRNDTSGKLTDLENLVGRYETGSRSESTDLFETEVEDITLYSLIHSPELITSSTLTDFIESLKELSDPIPGFPPNPRLQSVIQKAITPLEQAREMVSNYYWVKGNVSRLYSFFAPAIEEEEKPVMPAPQVAKRT